MQMNPVLLLRGVAVGSTVLAGMLCAVLAMAQTRLSLHTEREMVSYMIGMDVADSLQPVKEDMDMAAFGRGLRNVLDGQPPLLEDEQSSKLLSVLSQRAAVRSGQQVPGLPPGSMPP